MTLTGIAAAYAPLVTVALSVAIYAGMQRIARPAWYATTAVAA